LAALTSASCAVRSSAMVLVRTLGLCARASRLPAAQAQARVSAALTVEE